MFLTIRKKVFIVVICVLLCVSGIGIYFGVKSTVAKPVFAHTIVIDAGHGGVDGGAIGTTTEVTESYLNLQYALTLKEICEQYGFKVVLTRSDMSGLYSPFATNKKRSEMQKRQEIIENSSPDVVVSIHMNSFSTSQARGTQVFYGEGMESGEKLADIVQKTLNSNIEYAKQTAKVGDYYILNCTENPSILVECGYLSNPEEEVLLQDKTYMHKLCYNIFCGIYMYFDFS